MNHGERNETGERYCTACGKFVHPAQDLDPVSGIRDVCTCGSVFRDPVEAPAAQAEQATTVRIGNTARAALPRPALSLPSDILAAARDRRAEIDRLLAEHESLLDERDRLDRMIRAAERTVRRRKKKAPALKLAT